MRNQDETDGTRLYRELATWWPLVSDPADYAEEAAFFEGVFLENAARPCRTVLELGSGGGNNASHLKSRFDMVLVDRAPGMLEVSRRLNPELVHIEGDMRDVRLGRQFDGVFIHDAIGYMTTEADLQRAVDTAFAHCEPGGVALLAPDHLRENFRPSTTHGGHDGDDRALRYLEWTWDPDRADHTYLVEFAFLLRKPDQSVHLERDRHVLGLFSEADWRRTLTRAGFDPKILPFEHSEFELGQQQVVVVGTRPR